MNTEKKKKIDWETYFKRAAGIPDSEYNHRHIRRLMLMDKKDFTESLVKKLLKPGYLKENTEWDIIPCYMGCCKISDVQDIYVIDISYRCERRVVLVKEYEKKLIINVYDVKVNNDERHKIVEEILDSVLYYPMSIEHKHVKEMDKRFYKLIF